MKNTSPKINSVGLILFHINTKGNKAANTKNIIIGFFHTLLSFTISSLIIISIKTSTN